MRYDNFKVGTLVEPAIAKKANYRPIEDRLEIEFKPGMIGVVKNVHKSNGMLVEYFDPVTGLMENCRIKDVKIVAWPKGVVNLEDAADDFTMKKKLWIAGAMDFEAVSEYLKAIKILRPTYFNDLYVNTLRLPGVDTQKARKSLDEPAKVFYRPLIEARESLMLELSADKLKTGTNG